RIKLGYYDTLKTFKKIDGYLYNFKKSYPNKNIIKKLYQLILNYEDSINKSIVTKTINSSSTPLTDLLKKDIYLNQLTIKDYFIRSLELTMTEYNYQNDLLYDLDQVCKEINDVFKKEYQQR